MKVHLFDSTDIERIQTQLRSGNDIYKSIEVDARCVDDSRAFTLKMSDSCHEITPPLSFTMSNCSQCSSAFAVRSGEDIELLSNQLRYMQTFDIFNTRLRRQTAVVLRQCATICDTCSLVFCPQCAYRVYRNTYNRCPSCSQSFNLQDGLKESYVFANFQYRASVFYGAIRDHLKNHLLQARQLATFIAIRSFDWYMEHCALSEHLSWFTNYTPTIYRESLQDQVQQFLNDTRIQPAVDSHTANKQRPKINTSECLICYEQSTLHHTLCGHGFCQNCLDKWQKSTCMYCRQ